MAGVITKEMVKQHAFIHSLLDRFDELNESKKSNLNIILDGLIWNISKHFFIEENVIFSKLIKSNKQGQAHIRRLIKEHIEMKDLLLDLQKQLSRSNKGTTFVFRQVLAKHEALEVNSLYPLMDKVLSINEKKKIIFESSQISLK